VSAKKYVVTTAADLKHDPWAPGRWRHIVTKSLRTFGETDRKRAEGSQAARQPAGAARRENEARRAGTRQCR
jgi:hypothetical protein